MVRVGLRLTFCCSLKLVLDEFGIPPPPPLFVTLSNRLPVEAMCCLWCCEELALDEDEEDADDDDNDMDEAEADVAGN